MVFYNSKEKIKIKYLLVSIFIAISFYNIMTNLRYKNRNYDSTIREKILSMSKGKETGEINAALIGRLREGDLIYQYGRTLEGIIYYPIPRSIWKDKPEVDDTAKLGYELIRNPRNYWGTPPQAYGMAYYNGGYLSVIIFSILNGLLFGVVSKLFYKNNRSVIFSILYITCYGFFMDFYSFLNLSKFIRILILIGLVIIIDRTISFFKLRR